MGNRMDNSSIFAVIKPRLLGQWIVSIAYTQLVGVFEGGGQEMGEGKALAFQTLRVVALYSYDIMNFGSRQICVCDLESIMISLCASFSYL